MGNGTELPKRSGFIGPQRPVRCDVPIETMARYLSALTVWPNDSASPEARAVEDERYGPPAGGAEWVVGQ